MLRQEIREKLWPNDTIVEFDHSINAAIKRLRDALGDSAQEPRYVETVARRGYRFIGEVKTECDAPAEGVEPVATAPAEGSGRGFVETQRSRYLVWQWPGRLGANCRIGCSCLVLASGLRTESPSSI